MEVYWNYFYLTRDDVRKYALSNKDECQNPGAALREVAELDLAAFLDERYDLQKLLDREEQNQKLYRKDLERLGISPSRTSSLPSIV